MSIGALCGVVTACRSVGIGGGANNSNPKEASRGFEDALNEVSDTFRTIAQMRSQSVDTIKLSAAAQLQIGDVGAPAPGMSGKPKGPTGGIV